MIVSIYDWLWPVEDGPKVFGLYHIIWLIIMIIACGLSVYFFARKHNDKIDQVFIFSIGLMLISIEIFKQLFIISDLGYYNWNNVPLQFCSIPMYIAFTTIFIKNNKIKEIFYKFLASFGLIAGLAVMIYPVTVLNTKYVVMLIHTMIWHSSMVVMGVYLIVSRGYGKSLKEITSPFILFCIMVFTAVIINIIGYKLFFGNPNIETNGDLNLFYISPYYDIPLEILNTIRDKTIYPIYPILYTLTFLIGVCIIWLIIMAIKKLYTTK